MKKENTKKSTGDISALVCCSSALIATACLMELSIILKYILLVSAVGLSVYSVYLSLKREGKNNVEESSDKTIEE